MVDDGLAHCLGYEADFSDDEGTAGGYSIAEPGFRAPEVSSFWLIMQVCTAIVEDSNSHTTGATDSNADTAGIVIDTDYYVDVVFHSGSVQLLDILIYSLGVSVD